jgi:hypothetical protein
MALTDLLVGVAILVGLVGILLPFLPGSLLILGAVALWATETGTGRAWVVLAAVTLLLGAGAVGKYAVPGRRLTLDGVPRRTLLLGALTGVVGFFVVPVVGLVLGFVLGVYVAEARRLGRHRAGPSTWSALTAVGLSLLIELGAGLLAALTWLVGGVLA